MKQQISNKKLKKQFDGRIFSTGYCTIQEIFLGVEPSYYNSNPREFGWNWDCYVDEKHNIAITTGYRHTVGKPIPYALTQEYTEKARDIIKKYRWQKELMERLEDLREEFLSWVIALM